MLRTISGLLVVFTVAYACRGGSIGRVLPAAVADDSKSVGDQTVAKERIQTPSDADLAAARRFISAAIDSASAISEPDAQADAYCEIAEAQAKMGDNDAARKTLESAKTSAAKSTEKSNRGAVQSNIASTYAFLGDTAVAKEIIAGIDEEQRREVSRANLAETLAKAGDLAAANELADSITIPSNRANALKGIADAQARSGDFAGAKETIAKIAEKTDQAIAYRDLIESQAKAGDIAGAKETATLVPPETPWCSPLLEIVRVQAEASDFAGAKETAAQIGEFDRWGARAVAPAVIALAQEEAGQKDNARKSWEQSRAILKTLNSEERMRACCQIIEMQLEPAQLEEAKKTVEIMGVSNTIAGAFWHSLSAVVGNIETSDLSSSDERRQLKQVCLAYRAMVDAMAGDTAKAEATISRLAGAEGSYEIYAMIITKKVSDGRIAEAKTFATKIDKKEDRDSAYALLAAEQARAGDLDGALDTLAHNVEAPHDRCHYLTGLAEQLARVDIASGVRGVRVRCMIIPPRPI
jgi:hypothetical protein